jgi:hypothetical protein
MTSKSRGSLPVQQSKRHLFTKKGWVPKARDIHRQVPPSKRAKTLTDLVDKLTGKSDEKRNSF